MIVVKKKTLTILVFTIILLIVFSSLFIRPEIFTKHISPSLSDTILAKTYIEKADKIRSLNPDSAIINYNKAIVQLQSWVKAPRAKQILASSYVGLAFAYSEMGEIKKAWENDSIALSIAKGIKNKSVLAQATNIKGLILFKTGEYEKAMACYQEAMALAEEIYNIAMQVKISSNMAVVYYYKGDTDKTEECFRKNIGIAQELNDSSLIAGNYMNLAIILSNLGKADTASFYFGKALNTFNKIKDKNGELLCYQQLGTLSFENGDYNIAIENYNKSISFAHEMNDKINMSVGFHNLGEVYTCIGDYPAATENYFQSIRLHEEIGNKQGIASIFLSIGNLHLLRDENNEALEFYKKSYKINKEINYLQGIGNNYLAIANIFSKELNSDSAFVYYFKALKIYETTGNISSLSNLYANIGNEYTRIKRYNDAEKYLKKALTIRKDLSQEEEQAEIMLHLANLYLEKAKQEGSQFLYHAGKMALLSYNIAERLNSLRLMRDCCSVLKKYHQRQENYSKALTYSEQFNALTDSLFNRDKTEALVFAKARWNIEKKQRAVDNLENTKKLQQEIIQQKEDESRLQRLVIWTVALLFILAFSISGLIALYIRKKREAIYQKQLTNNMILRMQNLRNNLSPHFILNVLDNIWATMNDKKSSRQQFDNLLVLIRTNLINCEETSLPLNDEINFVRSYLELQKQLMHNQLDITWNIDSKLDLKQPVPWMILHIPVENAIKHGLSHKENNRHLKIDIFCESEHLLLTVTDNGVGLRAASYYTKGTGTGLKVLSNTIYILNQKNEKKISYKMLEMNDGETSSGVKVIITIPLVYNYNLSK